jgi:serine/threonine protein kinase
MGEVWKARREDTGAEVAVKILRAEHADEEQAAARFEREAQAAARLSHLGCVAVLDFGRDRVGMYLVMELVHGRSLADRRGGRGAPARRARSPGRAGAGRWACS